MILVIYFATTAYILVHTFVIRTTGVRPELTIVLALTVFGIASFTYFIGRAHPNNLNHILAPAVILGFYWMTRLVEVRKVAPAFGATAAFCCYLGVGLVFAATWGDVREKVDSSGAALPLIYAHHAFEGKPIQSVSARLWHRTATDPRVVEAASLIDEYSPRNRRIPLFMLSGLSTEVLMRTHRANVFPVNELSQDSLLQSARQRALHFPHHLQAGDVVIWEPAAADTDELGTEIVGLLGHQFRFQALARTPHGVLAVRLEPKMGAHKDASSAP